MKNPAPTQLYIIILSIPQKAAHSMLYYQLYYIYTYIKLCLSKLVANNLHLKSNLFKSSTVKNLTTIKNECRLQHRVVYFLVIQSLEFVPFSANCNCMSLISTRHSFSVNMDKRSISFLFLVVNFSVWAINYMI